MNGLSPDIATVASNAERRTPNAERPTLELTFARLQTCDDPAAIIHLPQSCPPGAGIPLAVKDNIDVAGMPTTAGCPGFAYQPAEDATAVARLRAAGYVPLAKTNLDQFATGLVGTRSPYGTPRNRYDPQRVPGGSSSGSAALVAAGLVPVALGTDTAGSGRVPAAFQNIVGIKPTRGWISTRGVVPAVRSLDCVSVFARTVAEAWAATTAAAGFDPRDPWSRARPEIALPAGPLRLGVPADLPQVDPGLRALWRAAVTRLAALGHTVVEIDLTPFTTAAAELYGSAWVAERTAAVGDAIDRGLAGLDPTVARIIGDGRRFSAVEAWQARDRLMALRLAAEAQWQRMDVLVLPTVEHHPTLAEVAADPIGANARLGRLTNFANLLDTCAVAVPAGFDGALPGGITLFAPAWHDLLLARLAARFLDPAAVALPGDDGCLELALFGAHLRGQPLNPQLVAWGGRFVRDITTAAAYRMVAIPGTVERPGLIRVGDGGAAIVGELWRLPAAGLGRLLASVAPPLAIGSVVLGDGRTVTGFTCEGIAAAGATDITAYADWRRYRGSVVRP